MIDFIMLLRFVHFYITVLYIFINLFVNNFKELSINKIDSIINFYSLYLKVKFYFMNFKMAKLDTSLV